MNKHLHIVCLDVPLPADYGGAIDMFYKIKALHKAGIRIHLHYFSYRHKGNPNELNQFCESIHVYERATGWKGFSLSTPYIVSSRTNTQLIQELNNDDHPILLEGIHCAGILPFLKKAPNRKIMVRMHNEECDYYRRQAKTTSVLYKKVYYQYESRLLKRYEKKLPSHLIYACINKTETERLVQQGFKNSFFLPAFTSCCKVTGEEGMGSFCLYHGNLSVAENEKAATWLLRKVFPKLKIPLIIAGKNPSRRLDKLAHLCQHTCLVANPSHEEINDLIRKAHINILPSFSNTGIKLKLLHALFEGRHCLVNDAMVTGAGLETACHIGSNADAFASIISQLHYQPFTGEEILLRKKLLKDTYDNDRNAAKIITYLL